MKRVGDDRLRDDRSASVRWAFQSR
jgi:hypothetical protein